MSRIIRNQLLSIWEFLQESHRTLADMAENNKKEEMIRLLADCQDGAITMGNQIEEIYGEGGKTVRCLEQYCETAYHIAENLEHASVCAEYCALAKQQLAAVRESMDQEIPDRMEIVFFPYKASMWDCLESIYLEAQKDENCEVYCVPIPYYDLNQDRTFGEFHDESEKYPTNIRITSWQDYEFEVRKPDVVFIHNPYDDQGVEESVEPRFYAVNLRMYTEKLVYVPYFVLSDIKSGDRDATERLKRSCFLPGVIHADKVIVESENMREVYMSEYERAADERGIMVDIAVLNDKILALGSPKSDKIQSFCVPDVVLSEECNSIIQKPNGERKKVVLYNISINDLLVEGEKLLDKIENVLAILRKRQDEVALWWRPQPLVRRTLRTMRPKLWDRYRSIVERYKEEGWGIYDDTDDWRRAAAVTDGYYGDWNTGVWEYQDNGKPVMIQKVDVLDNIEGNKQLKYQTLSFFDTFKENHELWVSNAAFNGIFKINMLSGCSQFIGRFDTELGYRGLHQQIIDYHDWLIFIPGASENIALFNRKTYEIEYISVVMPDSIADQVEVAGAYIYKDELWIFPQYLSQNIIIISLNDRQVRCDDILKKTMDKGDRTVNRPFFGMAAIKQEEVWMPIKNTSEILQYSFASADAKIYKLKNPRAKIHSIDAAEGTLWLTFSDTSEIMEWDPVTGNEDKDKIEAEWKQGKNPFSRVIPVSKSQCIILPAYTDEIILKSGDTFKGLKYPRGFYWLNDFKRDWPRFCTYKKEGEKIFIFPSSGNMLLIYDIQKEELEGRVCRIPEEWSEETVVREHIFPYYMQEHLAERKVAYEEQEDDLAGFLYCVQNNHRGSGKKEVTHNGEKIYQFFTACEDVSRIE